MAIARPAASVGCGCKRRRQVRRRSGQTLRWDLICKARDVVGSAGIGPREPSYCKLSRLSAYFRLSRSGLSARARQGGSRGRMGLSDSRQRPWRAEEGSLLAVAALKRVKAARMMVAKSYEGNKQSGTGFENFSQLKL